MTDDSFFLRRKSVTLTIDDDIFEFLVVLQNDRSTIIINNDVTAAHFDCTIREFRGEYFPLVSSTSLGQCHATAALLPEKRPGTQFIGGWLGSRAGLDGWGKFFLYRDSTPRPSTT